MKEIENLFFPLKNEAAKRAAEHVCENKEFAGFNPRVTENLSKNFLVIEMPVYTGNDRFQRKPALELLFSLGAFFGAAKAGEDMK